MGAQVLLVPPQTGPVGSAKSTLEHVVFGTSSPCTDHVRGTNDLCHTKDLRGANDHLRGANNLCSTNDHIRGANYLCSTNDHIRGTNNLCGTEVYDCNANRSANDAR